MLNVDNGVGNEVSLRLACDGLRNGENEGNWFSRACQL